MKLLISAVLLFSVTIFAAEKKQYRVTCPKCQTTVYAIPYSISTNGGRTVDGGVMVERTMHFKCPLEDKKPTIITARNEAFVAESKAVAVPVNPSLPFPMPMPIPVTAQK